MPREFDERIVQGRRRPGWMACIGAALAWAFLGLLMAGGLMTFGIL